MLVFLLAATIAASPTPVAEPTCVVPDGTRIHLELALSDEEKARGLMFRDYLPADRGMLFIFKQDDLLPFWMKNTMIPLDFIWLSADGRVVDVRANVPPCRMDPCPSYPSAVPARAVLEVNGGFARTHGVRPGAVLSFQGAPGYPVSGAKP